MNNILYLLLMLLLSAFFSLSETALTAVSRIKVKKMLKQGVLGAKALYDLRENPNKMLSTILVGNNLVNSAAVALATSIIIGIFEKQSIANFGIAVGISTVLMSALILIFGEITPKVLAIKYADRISLFVAPLISFIAVIFNPIIFTLNIVCKPIIKLFGGDIKAKIPFVTEEELKMLLSVSEEEGVLESEEKEMIHSIFEFGDSTVKEVMTPKPDIFAIDAALPIKEAIKNINEAQHSRVPVFEGTIDNIIGIVFIKDLLDVFIKGEEVELKKILRPPLFVPETKKLDELLHLMQSSHMHIAIIVDEYGSNSGLVTLEDLIEEIVGEIKDEFDIEEKTIEALSDGSFLVDGRISVSEINEKIKTSLPEGDYDTLGGFVFSLLGKLPSIGDAVRYDDLKIIVERISKRRITRVKIVKIKPDEAIAVGG